MSTFGKNKNLTIYNQQNFNGWEVVPGYTLINEYLAKVEQILERALTEHPRTLVIRFDLHFPLIPNCPDYPREFDSTVVTRFVESFKAQVRADLVKKNREGKRVHPCSVRYLWAKECNAAVQPHYHFALLLNKDTYYGLGDYTQLGKNLAGKIYRAWASALMYSPDDVIGLVHFPVNTPFYHLEQNSIDFGFKYQDVFRRLSYLAKAETKHYGDRSKNFGYSRR